MDIGYELITPWCTFKTGAIFCDFWEVENCFSKVVPLSGAALSPKLPGRRRHFSLVIFTADLQTGLCLEDDMKVVMKMRKVNIPFVNNDHDFNSVQF